MILSIISILVMTILKISKRCDLIISNSVSGLLLLKTLNTVEHKPKAAIDCKITNHQLMKQLEMIALIGATKD